MSTARRLALVTLALAAGAAGAQNASEHDLKAAFVYNFVQFTEWPTHGPEPASPGVSICVNAASRLSASLHALNGKDARGRRITVRTTEGPETVSQCQVLFLDAADKPQLTDIRRALDGANVLTISDDSDIIREGVVIGMALLANNRVGFRINVQAMKESGLTISSKLLRLSRPLP